MNIKYSGDLAKAIPEPIIGLLTPPEQIDAIAEELTREKYRRMVMLFDAYGIAHGNWEALCFALGAAHVPGLKIGKKPGKKVKWDGLLRAELVLAVKQTGIKNITTAIAKLATVEPWKSLIDYTRGAETLRDEYNRADSRWVNILSKAQGFDAKQKKSRVARNKSCAEIEKHNTAHE